MIGWAFHFKQYPTGAAANAQAEVRGARLVSIRNHSPQHADDAQNGTFIGQDEMLQSRTRMLTGENLSARANDALAGFESISANAGEEEEWC